ncbi:MAG TPA: oxygenase MpaB family protein [Longimicrobiales bacterium]|nr:oxygenase MpaB family protein [Longimicrobiales bacterium]
MIGDERNASVAGVVAIERVRRAARSGELVRDAVPCQREPGAVPSCERVPDTAPPGGRAPDDTGLCAAVPAAATDPDRGDFVASGSIVRRIWGDGDMVLMVFAGAAAEFALNRAVDWLFFTGKLPADPINRLFSTAGYSQHIVFADRATAARTLDRINAVHQAVERERGEKIPDWAHRDVLYMLIDYSVKAHELFARPLTADEQRDLYDVFYRVGTGLRIPDLPPTYDDWKADRERHLRRDLVNGSGTHALYAQYRKHLGPWRYRLLLRVQAMLVPAHVRHLLGLKAAAWLRPIARCYPLLVRAGLRPVIQWLLMPAEHLPAVRRLDRARSSRDEES